VNVVTWSETLKSQHNAILREMLKSALKALVKKIQTEIMY